MDHGIRDAFHIKSKFFDQKFHATFFMDPTEGAPEPRGPAPAPLPRSRPASRQASPAKPRAPPQDRGRAYEEVFDDAREAPAPSRPAAADGPEAAWASQVTSLRRQLADRDALLQSMERRLELAHHMHGHPRPAEPDEVQTLKQQVQEFRGALGQARSRVKELESSAAATAEENSWLRRLQDEMQRASPDLQKAAEAILHRERAQQEARNAKVLELLAAKDEAIAGLEARCDELSRQSQAARSDLTELATKLDAAEARVGDLLRAKADAEAQADKVLREAAEAQARTRAELLEARGEADALRRGSGAAERALLEERTRELEEALAQMERARADGTDEVSQGAVSGREVAALKRRVAELEGTLETVTRGSGAGAVIAELENRLTAMASSRIEATVGDGPAGLARAVQERDVTIALLSARLAGLEQRLGEAAGTAPGAKRGTSQDRLKAAQSQNAELESHNAVLRRQIGEKDATVARLARELEEAQAWPGGSRAEGDEGWKAAQKLNERLTQLSASEAALRAEVAMLRELATSAAREGPATRAEEPAKEAGEMVEGAIAEMHNRLLEEMSARRASEAKLRDVERDSTMERERLESEARRARLEGAQRLRALEEAVKSLQSRGDKEEEIARLALDADSARRAEARAREDAQADAARCARLSKDLRDATAELDELRARRDEEEAMEAALAALEVRAAKEGILGAVGDELRMVRQLQRDREADRVRHASECARLRVAAEDAGRKAAAAEKQASALEAKLAELQKQARGKPPTLRGTAAAREAGAAAESAAALEAAQQREGHSARRVAVLEREVEGLEEELHKAGLENASLRAEVAEASRELAAVQSNAAEAHRALVAAREEAASRSTEAQAHQSAEVAAVGARCADAERRAASAESRVAEVEEEARALKLEAARLRAEVGAREKQAGAVKRQAEVAVEEARVAVAGAERERDASAATAEERRVQISILMETVEALQAGSHSERDQRVVTLTAQLAAAKAVEGSLERRAEELMGELEEALRRAAKAGDAAARMEEGLVGARAECEALRESGDKTKEELKAARASLRRCEEEQCSMARRLDQSAEALRRCQADLAGTQGALESARVRHMEELWAEREARAAALKEAKEETLRALAEASRGGAPAEGEDAVDSPALLGALAEVALVGGGKERDGRVLDRMKAVVVEAERRRCRAEADARVARAELAMTRARLRAVEPALEKKTAQWEVAESARASEAAAARQHAQQSTRHMQERLDLASRHIERLSERCSAAAEASVKAAAELAGCRGGLEVETARSRTLEQTVRVLEAAAKESEARVAAVILEHAGTAEVDAGDDVASGVGRRDLAMKEYFEREVMRALVAADPAAKVLALTREVCGLKLVESQLLASLRAAKKRGDAARMQCSALREALHDAQGQVEGLKTLVRKGEDVSGAAAAAAGAAQLSAKQQELHRSKEEALVVGQRLAASESRCQELERERARLEALAVKATGDAQAAVNRVRSEMLAVHEARIEEAESEMRQLRERHAEMLRHLRAEAARRLAEEQEERERAVAEATEGLAAPGEVAALREELRVTRAGLADAEERCRCLEKEAESLLSDLKGAQRECLELQDGRETHERAVAELERTLGAVAERSASAGLGGPGARTARRAAAAKGGVDPSAVGELSRQLVQTRLSEADAQRRLRVAARTELELREQLRRRDARIDELKGPASDAGGRPGPARGASSVPGSPHKVRPGRAPAGGVAGGRGEGAEPGRCAEVASLRAELVRREAQIEHLEVSLARAVAAGRDREADLLTLRRKEADTDEAEAATQRYRRELLRLHDAISASVSTAKAVVSLSTTGVAGRPAASAVTDREARAWDETRTGEAIDALNGLVQSLIHHAKDKDASLKKAVARGKALEGSLMAAKTESYAAPLEASQRAVIRDLTARCNQLAHDKAELRSERDRLAERLERLRGSLGAGGKASAIAREGAPGGKENEGPKRPGLDVEAVLRKLEDEGDAGAEIARTTGARAATAMGPVLGPHGDRAYPSPGDLQGRAQVNGESVQDILTQAQNMGELLGQHLAALDAARERVAAVAEGLAPVGGATAAGDVGRLFVGEDDRRAVLESAAAMAAELQSLRSAVRVLVEDVGALGAFASRSASDLDAAASEREARLAEECQGLRAQAEVLRDDLADARDAADQAAGERQAAADDARRYRDRCEELNAEVRSLEGRVATAEREALGRLHAAEKAAAEEGAKLRLEISKLEAALAGAEASKKELLTHAFEVGAFGRGVAGGEASGSVAGSVGDFAAVAARAAEAEAKLAAAERRAETERAQLEGKVAALEDRVRDAERRGRERAAAEAAAPAAPAPSPAPDAAAAAATTTAAAADAERRAEQAEAKAAARKAQARALKARCAEVRESLRAELAASEARNGELVTQLQGLRNALEDLTTRVEVAEAAREDLSARLRDREEELRRRDEEREGDRAGLSGAREALARVEADAAALGKECQGLEARVREQQREVEACAEREREAAGRLERARAERKALERRAREAEGRAEEAERRSRAEQSRADEAERRAAEARAEVAAARGQHEAYERDLAERHMATLRDMEQRIGQEREALRAQAEAAAAHAEARGKGSAEMQVAEARARAAAAEAEASQRALRADERAAECARQLEAYRRFRQQEVAGLEAQLRQALGAARPGPPSAGDAGEAAGAGAPGGDAEGSLAAICRTFESDVVSAALRQAELEQLQREQAEAAARELRAETDTLRARVKSLGKEQRQRDRVESAARASRAETDGLRARVAELEEEARAARKESARRLRALRELQSQAEGGGDADAAVLARVLAEREAREGAEARAAQLRAEAQRRETVAGALRKRVEDLEAAARAHKEADWEGRCAAAEARCRVLQGEASRKQEMLTSLRGRMDALVAAAEERGAVTEQEKAQGAVSKLRSEAASRARQLEALKAQVAAARDEAAAARRDAEEAAKREAGALRGSVAEGQALRARAEALVAGVKRVCRLLLRCIEALEAGAGRADASRSIAEAVGMDASDVQGLLRGGTSAGAAEAVAGLLAQLEAAVAAPVARGRGGELASLDALVEGLERAVLRVTAPP